jgi:hypothetical protein
VSIGTHAPGIDPAAACAGRQDKFEIEIEVEIALRNSEVAGEGRRITGHLSNFET